MQFLFITSLLLYLLVIPVITGLVAKRSGRKFWSWFGISLLLPVIAVIFIVSHPLKHLVNEAELKPVENDEIFDYLFANGKVDHYNLTEQAIA